LPFENLRVLSNVEGLTVLSESKERLFPTKTMASRRDHPSEIVLDFTGAGKEGGCSEKRRNPSVFYGGSVRGETN
jgi:hypothetical protein